MHHLAQDRTFLLSFGSQSLGLISPCREGELQEHRGSALVLGTSCRVMQSASSPLKGGQITLHFTGVSSVLGMVAVAQHTGRKWLNFIN